MRRLAKLHQKVRALDNEVTEYFIGLGFPEDFLRSGCGWTLDEIQDGVDVTDEFCQWIESGDAEKELKDECKQKAILRMWGLNYDG